MFIRNFNCNLAIIWGMVLLNPKVGLNNSFKLIKRWEKSLLDHKGRNKQGMLLLNLAPFHRITNWAFDSPTLMWVEMRLFYLMCHINKQYLQIENELENVKHCSLSWVFHLSPSLCVISPWITSMLSLMYVLYVYWEVRWWWYPCLQEKN